MGKRIRVTLAATLTAGALMAASAGGAFAFANPGNNGNAENAPGQEQAQENCGETIMKQAEEKGVSAGGGPKEGVLAPTNCDKFFNP